jgi:hypothetical protein
VEGGMTEHQEHEITEDKSMHKAKHTPKPETCEQIEMEPTRERLLDALEDLGIGRE